MGNITFKDLFHNDDLMDSVIKEALKSNDVVNEFVKDIIDQLSDGLRDEPEFKGKIIDVIIKTSPLRRRLVSRIANKVID